MSRLPNSAHTDLPWRVHEFTRDFEIEDVWALPTPGGPGDLDKLVRQFASDDDEELSGVIVRFLFAVRWKLGALLGWDGPDAGVGKRVPSLRDRLPADLRNGPRGPDLKTVPFTSVYQTDTEWVAESANKTVRAVMHIGWVPDGSGGYRGQMAALVQPNGVFGKIYMHGITPIRRALVVPTLVRAIGREWRQS